MKTSLTLLSTKPPRTSVALAQSASVARRVVEFFLGRRRWATGGLGGEVDLGFDKWGLDGPEELEGALPCVRH